ncbi:MAG: hypothetical protein R3D03_04580 [Geminicoccaceae bacterium]
MSARGRSRWRATAEAGRDDGVPPRRPDHGAGGRERGSCQGGGEDHERAALYWWNFVASSIARLEQAKEDWSAGDWQHGRFILPPGDEDEFIPAPEGLPMPKERRSGPAGWRMTEARLWQDVTATAVAQLASNSEVGRSPATAELQRALLSSGPHAVETFESVLFEHQHAMPPALHAQRLVAGHRLQRGR